MSASDPVQQDKRVFPAGPPFKVVMVDGSTHEFGTHDEVRGFLDGTARPWQQVLGKLPGGIMGDWLVLDEEPDPVRYTERLRELRRSLDEAPPYLAELLNATAAALSDLIDLLLEKEQHLDRSTQ